MVTAHCQLIWEGGAVASFLGVVIVVACEDGVGFLHRGFVRRSVLVEGYILSQEW